MKTRWLGNVCILAVSLAFLCCSGKGWAQSCAPGNCVTTTATAATFVNTGSPAANASGETLLPTEWIAVQFTLANPAAITSIGGYFGSGTGGGLNVVIRTDNEADPTLPVPGSAIWSQTETIPSLGANSLVTFSGYLAVLAAGTYWVSFEPPTTSTLMSFMPGPPAPPGMAQMNNAFFVPTNGRWINMNEGLGHTTNYPSVVISGYDLGTASGSPLITSGTFARTITSGTVFNKFPFTQDGTAIGGVGQADTSQWNIYSPAAVANAYGTISANPKTQGDILTAGAYSATGTNDSGVARGIVFSTFLNMTGGPITNLKVNAALDGSILSTDSGSPVTVTAGVYVFDPADFTTEINSVVSGPNSTCGSSCPYYNLAQFLLGGSNVIVGDGAIGSSQYDLTNLFNNYVDDSWGSPTSTTFPLVCTGACTAEASTAGTPIPKNGLFTVMFDVMAASEGSTAAQSQAIGDFLSTLQADLTHGLFTDGTSGNNGLGNPISGIVGPIATTLPDTPAKIALSQSATSSPVGSTVTLTAAVTDATGNPVPNAFVRFVFASTGPHAGNGGPAGTPIGTDQFGNATLSFTDTLGKAGTDSITANIGSLLAPTTATITWTSPGPLYSNVTLSPNPGTISLPNSQTYTATGSDIFGHPITTDASGELTFTISPDGTCMGNTCTPTASGMHTVTGSYNYPLIGTTVSGTATLNVNASGASNTVTFTTAPPSSAAYNSMFTVAAKGLGTGAITYTSSGGCTNSGATYTMTSGTTACSVTATQAADSNYPQGSVSQSVNATPVSNTVTFTTTLPSSAAYKSMFTVAASGLGTGAISYTSGGGCTNSGATYTMTSGTTACSVTATQAADSNYAQGSVSGSVTAAKASNTVTFTTPPPSSAADNSMFTVAASGLGTGAISYTSGGGCTNSGATYTMTSGTTACSVTATQAADSNYTLGSVSASVTALPANQATFTITPNPAAETVTRGVVGGFLLKLQSVNGFNANVTLTCSGGPAGSYCVDFPMTVKVNGTDYAVSGILFPKNSNPGTYVITFTGVSGSQTVKATATFTVK